MAWIIAIVQEHNKGTTSDGKVEFQVAKDSIQFHVFANLARHYSNGSKTNAQESAYAAALHLLFFHLLVHIESAHCCADDN